VCKKWIKNSQPFVRKMTNVRTPQRGFFLTHTVYTISVQTIGYYLDTTQNGSYPMVSDNSNEWRLTLMPNVKTVTIILKTRASESCHSADTALSPIVPLTTSDVSAVTFSLKSLHTPSQTTSRLLT